MDYYDKAPFKFNGKIDQARVEYPLGAPPSNTSGKRK